MSRLMRMAYGHGGTRLERILVAAPHGEAAPAPRRLRLLLLAVWLIVPLLVSRYAVPTATPPATIIDLSRLEVTPLPLPEPPRVVPAEPLPKPLPTPPQAARKPREYPFPEEVNQPAITRPAAARTSEDPDYRPRPARERLRVGAESGAPAETHVRREIAASAPPSERTVIARTRGAAAADPPAAHEQVAPLRRAPAAEGAPREGGTALRPLTRKERPADSSGRAEQGAPRITASRESAPATGAGDPKAPPAVGLARGMSFTSLEICSSTREEEDAIRAVLGVVAARRSCRDETGEYQFKGTKRISSFNLIIYPAQGRRPSNRCEELENAYRCLKAR